MTNSAARIMGYLLQYIPQYPRGIVARTMQHFGVSRTTVLRHLNKLIKTQQVIKTGSTKQVSYSLAEHEHINLCLSINSTLDQQSPLNQT